MPLVPSRFLTAQWRYLAILNFAVAPKVLLPLVPAGTELDAWQGKTFLSVVGFLFLNTRLFGIPIPFHRNFEEVNLRFFVRRQTNDGWRRAVVFVKEVAPRRAIAWTARALYHEHYVALPMDHRMQFDDAHPGAVRRVSYSWMFNGRENRLDMTVEGAAQVIQEGTEEAFITEHYWGYSRRRDGGTLEYRVEHPRWRVWRASEARVDCDVAQLYGEPFVEALHEPPASAFLADGSEVTVFRGVPLAL